MDTINISELESDIEVVFDESDNPLPSGTYCCTCSSTASTSNIED